MPKKTKKTYKHSGKSAKTTRRDSKAKTEELEPNNPYWYGSTPEIIRDTASFSYGYPIGRPIESGNTLQSTTYGASKIEMPGVMGMYLHPAIGISKTPESPINIATRNLYSWVRHANSGHTNYDAPDLMLYILAMDQIYSFYAWGVRLYGLLRMYNHVNRYWPRAILQTEHIDVDSFERNLANFRYYLDIFCKKAGSLCVPNAFAYFARHMQIFSEVYCDAPVLKAQLYVYTPSHFWKFDELSGAGRLVSVPVRGNSATHDLTYDEFIAFGNAMLEAVLSSEDMNIMSGDILKAFDQNSLVKLSYVPLEYETPIIYSPEMLSQIQNASILTYGTNMDGWNITQNTTNGALIFNPINNVYSVLYDTRKIITMVKEDVKPEETIVATRLTAFPHPSTEGSPSGWKLETCGSEILTHLVLGHYNNSFNFVTELMTGNGISLDWSNPLSCAARLQIGALIEKFNQHPMIPVFGYTASDGSNIVTRLQDIDNYTVIEEEELDEMNQGALLSMFTVPQLGMWNGGNKSL